MEPFILGSITIICLVSLLPLLIFGLIIYALFRHLQAGDSTQANEPLTEQTTFLEQARARLLPWSSEALADLAARWEGEWSYRFGQVGTFQGIIKSLSDPEVGWMALAIHRPSANTTMVTLATSERQLRLRMTHNLFTLASEGVITVDDEEVGFLRTPGSIHASGVVELFDAERHPVGYYRRRGRKWAGALPLLDFASGHAAAGRLTIFYGPIVLRDRHLASLVGTWVRIPSAEHHARQKYGQPIAPYAVFRHLRSDLTREERHWLLALVAFEVGLDAAAKDVKRVQDGHWRVFVREVVFEELKEK